MAKNLENITASNKKIGCNILIKKCSVFLVANDFLDI